MIVVLIDGKLMFDTNNRNERTLNAKKKIILSFVLMPIDDIHDIQISFFCVLFILYVNNLCTPVEYIQCFSVNDHQVDVYIIWLFGFSVCM